MLFGYVIHIESRQKAQPHFPSVICRVIDDMTAQMLFEKIGHIVAIVTDEDTYSGFATRIDENENLELIETLSGIGGTTRTHMVRIPRRKILSCKILV